ncbi:hypothetical protein [Paenibacillus luteus]|uniref:hypothetical protein n=1 Tax=Paenibacillus luteus TaxID=2545753 RepID=UPI0011436463|nr:hypothetical protein [Paenibacillus luteus]
MQDVDLGVKNIPKVDLQKFLEFKGYQLLEVETDLMRINELTNILIGKHYFYNEKTYELGCHISFCMKILQMSYEQAINDLLEFYFFYQ